MDITDEEMPTTPPPVVEEIVAEWLSKQDTITPADFHQHWKKWVPRIYSPRLNESCLNWQFDEDLAQTLLFSVLEQYICNGDPSSVLAQPLDKPPSVCGRVFKMGEPTYSCRECGMDNTCVLCVDCFKNSDHR